jgi:hypothetical protein
VKDREDEIEVFTPAELAQILFCASDRMISFLIVCEFAGIRRAQIQQLEWGQRAFRCQQNRCCKSSK